MAIRLVLPHAFDMATGYAAQYTGDDFERITMALRYKCKLDEIVAATGESKTETLNRLVK